MKFIRSQIFYYEVSALEVCVLSCMEFGIRLVCILLLSLCMLVVMHV